MMLVTTAAVVALVVCGAAAAAAQASTALNVYGTSDISDSNLLAHVIEPGYTSFSGGDTINYTAVGSGAAISAAEVASNEIDAIIVHSPPLEAPFVAGGYSYNNNYGNAVFYNDYVIPGPTSDPAGVDTSPTDMNNTVGAFERIAVAGGAGKATFVSRNDNSGTNVEEQTIWGLVHTADPSIPLQLAPNAPAGNTTRYIPWSGSGTGIPAWYVETDAEQGQNLIDTNGCNASPPTYPTTYGGCYTIVDRGTFNYQDSLGNTSHLKVLSQKNCSTCTGGAGLLTNPFHAYLVKSTMANKPGDLPAAQALISYLTSNTFQNTSLPGFMAEGQPEFYADAYAQLTNVSIPASAAPNTAITITATLTYPPPVAQPIGGMPVQLQDCTGTGCSNTPYPTACTAGNGWSNVGSPVSSNTSTGVVSFTPTIGTTTTTYRFCMNGYSDATLASLFSFNVDSAELGTHAGVVTVT
jgi:ABC-type tungstate transport system permease subunit